MKIRPGSSHKTISKMNDETLESSDNSSAAHTLPVPKFILDTPVTKKRSTSER